MNINDAGTSRIVSRWFIDLDWYPLNNRSFFSLVRGYLCSRCLKRLKDKGATEVTELLNAIRDCCSKETGFISKELPVLESVFRLFLSNGNQPLELEVMRKQLYELRGGDAHQTSVELLSRLLKADRYYGLRQVSD